MPTTPRYALPYPTLPAVSDVPADIKALADALDLLTLTSPIVTYPARLPNAASSPRTGDRRVFFIPQASVGAANLQMPVHWDVVWNPAGWWYLGGPPLANSSSSSGVTGWAAGGWTVHPWAQVTTPENGSYLVRASYEAVGPAATQVIAYGRIRRVRDNLVLPLVSDLFVAAGTMGHGIIPWQLIPGCLKGDVLTLEHNMSTTDTQSRNAQAECYPVFLSPP